MKFQGIVPNVSHLSPLNVKWRPENWSGYDTEHLNALDDGLQGNIHSDCVHLLQQDSGKVPVFFNNTSPPVSARKVLMDAWVQFRDPDVNSATV